MTISQVVNAMRRRWYIPLAILACVTLVTVLLARDGGTYTSRTVISFLRPSGTSLAPDNGANDASIIAYAAAVVLETNNGRLSQGYSMADAPYYGAGIREGTLVELTNSGNQWVSNVSKAEVEIDIAGRSYEWVQSRQKDLVDKVLSVAESMQAAVPAESRISASVVPLTTQIDYISASRRTQFTAGAALLAVAVITAAWGSVAADRALSKRRSDASRRGQALSGRVAEGAKS